MVGKEGLVHEVTARFDKAIYTLRDSGVGTISEIAARSMDKIRRRELLVVDKTSQFNMPTMTGFDLLPLSEDKQKYISVVALDTGNILSRNQQSIQGDLVRSLAIADQYPFNGYERRYSQVYADALQVQATWLQESGTPPLQFDPRTSEKNSLINQLVGDEKYYSDVGFDDWQKAIAEHKASSKGYMEISLLNQLQNAKEHFLVVRQRFASINYEQATRTFGSEYQSWSADKRAETTATLLMGLSVYARRPDNLN